MSSKFGNRLTVSVFGESHGKAVGAVVDGFPAGEAVNMNELRAFLCRRAGGRSKLTTGRKEEDEPVFLSGLENGKTSGTLLEVILENKDVRPVDYQGLRDIPRPGHADYTAYVKYGAEMDMRGGGHFSGRLTAPLCAVGGIALQILSRRGIFVGAHLANAAGRKDRPFQEVGLTKEELLGPGKKEFPVNDDEAGKQMIAEIERAATEKDSVGGIIECGVLGLPAGLGEPMFDGVENRLAAAIFGIPAVKGMEFGSGFSAAGMRGSENNDPFVILGDGRIATKTNHHGGALGGITTGMPVLLRAVVKPTPSIGQKQQSVNLVTGQPAELEIRGRHDPCAALRAVPCVEAVTALVILDMLLQEGRI